MSSERGVCTPSPQLTVWLLSMLRLLRCDIQDPEKSGKRKNQGTYFEGRRRQGEGMGGGGPLILKSRGGKNPARQNVNVKANQVFVADI